MTSTKKPTQLTPELLSRQTVKKTAEAPTEEQLSEAMQLQLEELVEKRLKAKQRDEYAATSFRTLSWKADPDRYQRLSEARFKQKRTGQEIITEAMDQWFKKNKF